MFYDLGLTIYLWLIPVISLLLLPLVLPIDKLSRNIAHLFKRKPAKMTADKRVHPRITFHEDTIARIAIGDTICTGLVGNMSKFGISLKNLPEVFSEEIDKLTVVIRKYGVDHNLTIVPKWKAYTETGHQLGAEIAFATSGWEDFLVQTEKINRA